MHDPPATPVRMDLRVVLAALGLQVSGPLALFITGALGVQLQQAVGMDEQGLGIGLGVAFGTTALGSLIGGPVGDRLGWQVTATTSSAISSIALLGLALATESQGALTFWLGLAGAASGFSLPTTNLMLLREVPPARQAAMFGLKMATVPFATMFAGVSLPLLALTVGWRFAYLAAVAFPLASLIGVLPRLSEGLHELRTASHRRRRRPTMVSRPLLLLTVGALLGNVAVGSLNAFFVVYAVELGIREGYAGVLVAIGGAASIVARLGGGFLAGRLRSPGLQPVAALLASGALAHWALASGRVPMILVVLAAYGAGWGWSGLFQYGVVVHHPLHPASATGIVALGLGIGMAIGPILFGAIAPKLGFTPAWMFTGAASALGGSFVFAAARLLKRGSGRGP